MMRERKSSHKKCKLLKKSLQIFLPIFSGNEQGPEKRYHPPLEVLKAIKTPFKRRAEKSKKFCCNVLKLGVKTFEQWGDTSDQGNSRKSLSL